MRPKIPEPLEERVNEVYRLGNFATPGELVREATREYVAQLEENHHDAEKEARDMFEYQIRRTSNGAQIRLSPRSDSPVRFKYFSKGDPPHTTYLDTGTTIIGQDELEEELQIDGVERASILTKGEIKINVSAANEVPLTADDETLVDRFYDVLGNLIRERNRRVIEGEETRTEAKKRALRRYWPFTHQM